MQIYVFAYIHERDKLRVSKILSLRDTEYILFYLFRSVSWKTFHFHYKYSKLLQIWSASKSSKLQTFLGQTTFKRGLVRKEEEEKNILAKISVRNLEIALKFQVSGREASLSHILQLDVTVIPEVILF